MDDNKADIKATNRKLQSTQETDKTFSLTSELKPNAAKWDSGSKFTCKSTHNSSQYVKTIRLCDVYANVPPSIHVEIPSLETVMKAAASQVQATCLVHTAFKAEVTWLIDGRIITGSQVNLSRNTTDLTSTLTLPSSQWKQLKLLTCKAEHKCFSAVENQISLSEPSATAPLVEIRRSLLGLQKGNSAVLECDVTQLSSTDIFITFQANGVGVSEGQYVKLPRAPGLHSVSRQFTVPSSHWNKDTNFTCKVNQGFTRTTESKSTGRFITDPSVELLLVPRMGTEHQKLLCLGRGFDPQIIWMSESERRSSSSDDISMDAQGHVTVTSQLQIPLTEWETGKVFTCETLDKSLNKRISESISICSASPQTVGIHVQGPPLSQLHQQKQVTVSCLLIGSSLSGFSISWKVGGRVQSDGFTKGPIVKHSNGTETLRCFLHISAEDWLAHKLVHCVAKHRCYNQSHEGHVGKSKEISEGCSFFNELSSDDVAPDIDYGSWNMAVTFLLFFLIAIIYCVSATLIKTKK